MYLVQCPFNPPCDLWRHTLRIHRASFLRVRASRFLVPRGSRSQTRHRCVMPTRTANHRRPLTWSLCASTSKIPCVRASRFKYLFQAVRTALFTSHIPDLVDGVLHVSHHQSLRIGERAHPRPLYYSLALPCDPCLPAPRRRQDQKGISSRFHHDRN